LVATKDNCALLEAVVNEAGRVGTIPERVARLEATQPYSRPPGRRFTVRDPAFRVSSPASVTPRCRADL